MNGREPESKRRLLQKYLAGEAAPGVRSARQLATILGQSADQFVTERIRPSRKDLDAVWDELAEIRALVDELSRVLGEGR